MKRIQIAVGFNLPLLLLLLLTGNSLSAQSSTEQGKSLFQQRCAACHAIGKQLVGPNLAGVDQLRSEEWIINFVRSSQAVIKSGDTAATALFAEFNNTVMPDHPDLSEADIKSIIAYIAEETKNQADAGGKIIRPLYKLAYPNKKGDFIHRAIFLDPPGNHQPLKPTDYTIWIMIGTVVIFLTVALVALVKIKDMEEGRKSKESVL